GKITPPTNLVKKVFFQTEGNPLFIVEMVRLMGEEGLLQEEALLDAENWSIRLPEGVREVIGRRLDRLSERTNEMLTTAAAVGRDFRLGVLSELSDETSDDQLMDAIEEAIDSKIIEELPDAVGSYRFTHALIRETLTSELSLTRRVGLHARIAKTLEDLYGDGIDQRAAELAYHYSEAESVLGTEKLIHYSVIAGEMALEANDPLAASVHFGQAAKAISEHSPDRIVARVERGVGLAGLATARQLPEFQASGGG
ncbi:MAG: hypothetical protein QF357_01510, partial [Dehalococcoidia bacterium]|nr:hypothetical protein [Dehalococcoidia bacterium]